MVHHAFKLNGNSYNEKTLKPVAHAFVSKGTEYEKDIGVFLLDWLSDKETVVVTTSGSTGKPKPIKLSKFAMVNSAIATGAFFNLQEKNKALLCLPTKYIAGKMMLVRALVLGLEIDCVAPASKIVLKAHSNYSFAAMVPLQVQNSIEALKAIKILIIGGATVSPNLMALFKNIKTEVYETYGMTETVTHIALKKLNHFDEAQSHLASLFKTLPNVSISQDQRMCLVIEAPKLTKGKIITNDVVNLHSNTQFEWLGRYDNIINSGGIKINPEQIEKKLKIAIKERFFIASEKDHLLGEKLLLIIETDDETITKTISNKLKTLSHLNKYETPKTIIPVKKFKETNTGKIKRKETLIAIKS